MRKKVIILLLVGVLAILSLVACGSGSAVGVSTAATTAANTISIADVVAEDLSLIHI